MELFLNTNKTYILKNIEATFFKGGFFNEDYCYGCMKKKTLPRMHECSRIDQANIKEPVLLN